jgi:hypothetical protein
VQIRNNTKGWQLLKLHTHDKIECKIIENNSVEARNRLFVWENFWQEVRHAKTYCNSNGEKVKHEETQNNLASNTTAPVPRTPKRFSLMA